MKMPTKVKVGWKVYDVVEWNHEVAEANRKFGECESDRAIIRLDVTFGPARAAEVLFHECLHAVFENSSARDFREEREDAYTEEYVVSMLSNGVMTLYRDNPELARWFAWAQTQ